MSTPSLLLETIRCEEGIVYNLSYHQKRFDQSRQSVWNMQDKLDLKMLLSPPKKGLFRCRIIYGKAIESIQYIPYTPKSIHTLKIVPSSIRYPFKYADRSELDSLFKAHADVDDIIIAQNNLVTDTTIANIAFYDGQKWLTPKIPLLEGTMRAKLVEEGFLHLEDIHVDHIARYRNVALMNAMIGFKIINPIILPI